MLGRIYVKKGFIYGPLLVVVAWCVGTRHLTQEFVNYSEQSRPGDLKEERTERMT